MKRTMQFMLRIYKRCISPMLPHSCRFVPTCSEYAMEAIEWHGALRGSLLAAGRLLRCHPFAKAGVDPVPDSETAVAPAEQPPRRRDNVVNAALTRRSTC
ncbi:MAG TPA: membrane protein insertion efficiency factor YidD [Candidatus Binatia bacterium]|nr:membrane protein insertion efficiency factor YidD [Candidatus Binatia bacterium]